MKIIIEVGAKLLSNLVLFSIYFSDILLGFHDSTGVVPLNYLMHFLTDVNTK